MRIHSLFGAATLLAISLLMGCSQAQAEGLKVVTNTEQPLTLSREQVRNLYMGATLGYGLKPVALPASNRHRSMFNTRVIGLAEARIQSYWAQMRFTGRLRPPTEVADERSLSDYLTDHPGAVGYLPASYPLPDHLTVLYQTD